MQRRRQFILGSLGTVGIAAISGCTSTGGSDTTTEPLTRPSQLTQSSKTTAEDGDSEDVFGYSVAVSGDGSTAIVGAPNIRTPGDENPNEDNAGSAYVFSGTSGSWTLDGKLTAKNGDSYDHFGASVAVSEDGSTAIVGAGRDADPNGDIVGSAYVFSGTSGSWTQEAKLTAEDGDSYDHFGFSVAVSGDGSTAIVGANRDADPNGDIVGSAYVFSGTSGSWTQDAKLTAEDGDADDNFGESVAVSSDGSTAIVGNSFDDDPNGDSAGSAYVFSGTDGPWTQEAKLTAEDGDADDNFGESVAVSEDGSTAIVGNFFDDDPNGDSAGSAYVFSGTSGSWTQDAKLTAEDGDSDDIFGKSVAVSSDGSAAMVGAPGDEAGSAYVFSGTGGSWTQTGKLTAEDGDSGDFFGDSVAVSSDGSAAMVGAPGDEDPNGYNAGSAYVFE